MDGENRCGPEGAYNCDPLKIVVDFVDRDTSGYAVSNWLRDKHAIHIGLADHRRIIIQIAHGDTPARVERLLEAMRGLPDDLDLVPNISLPGPGDLELETVMRPRDAFFSHPDTVDILHAAGRVCAELVTPYPPGVPALAPGEVITQPVLDYLRSGLAAGMTIPDAADPTLGTLRVVPRHRAARVA